MNLYPSTSPSQKGKVQSCPTRLLSDTPAESDAFGGHQRIAEAIASLCLTETGGKAIALIGPWGSGKSTVIKLLDAKLCASNKSCKTDAKVFSFDAWGHEGDPLRRSFLERLIAFLVNAQWTTKMEWKEDLDKLTNRTENIISKSGPVLTSWGWVLALLTLLAPLGYALVSTSGSIVSLGLNRHSIFWIGFTLAILPVCTALIILIILKVKRYLSHKDNDEDKVRNALWGLFFRQSHDITRTHTTRTPDPTSIEFQQLFKKLLRRVLKKDKRRRLVIVIDNLDRVNVDDALAIWATMRTFVDVNSGSGTAESWVERLWVVVPFDLTGSRRLWAKAQFMENEFSEREENLLNKDKDQLQAKKERSVDLEELADAFINKTFQVKFEVPPPLLSDWKSFLLQSLKKAFPKHDEKDFHGVYRLYSIYGPMSKDRPVTPRDIKLFVNQLGVQHRVWGDSIPMLHQALYVLLKDSLVNIDEVFLDETLVDSRARRFLGENFCRDLAALHFAVMPEKALQVAYGPRIERILDEGNGKELQHMINIPGVVEVCENIIEQNLEDLISDPQHLIAAAQALSETNYQGSDLSWSNIWGYLRKALMEVERWPLLDELTGKGIVTILESEQQNFKQAATTVLQSIREYVFLDKNQSWENKEVQTKIMSWVRAVLPILRVIEEKGTTQLLSGKFAVPGGARDYIEILKVVAKESDAGLLHWFIPEVSAKEVVNELVKLCSSGAFNNSIREAVTAMSDIQVNWDFTVLIRQLQNRLNSNNNLQIPEIEGLVGTLLELSERKIESANQALNHLAATQGHLQHRLSSVNQNNSPLAFAYCTYAILTTVPRGEPKSHVGNSQNGLNIYRRVLDQPEAFRPVVDTLSTLVRRWDSLEKLISIVEDIAETEKLIKEIVKGLLKEDKVPKYFWNLVIPHFKFFNNTIPERLKEIIKRGIKEGQLIQKLVNNGFSLDLADLYLICFEAAPQDEKVFRNFIVEGLRGLDKKGWLTIFKQNATILTLVKLLAESEQALIFHNTVADALLEHIEELRKNQKATSNLSSNLAKILLNTLTNHAQKTFFLNLLDSLLRYPDLPITPAIDLFEDELITAHIFDEEKADDVVRSLARGILERKDKKEVQFLDRLVSETAVLQKCKSTSTRDFQDRLVALEDWEELPVHLQLLINGANSEIASSKDER